MKLSVVIVAHDEASSIRACLESIQRQTLKPDEIILIAHNCTDDTVKIAREFPEVRVIELSGPGGVIYARIKGFEEAQGEIIACIDGDSIAAKNWLQGLILHLSDLEISAVGGGVWLQGGLRASLISLDFFWLKPIYNPKRLKYFWGANFAIRKSVYEEVGGLMPFIELSQKLGLSLAPEDLYLALKVWGRGGVAIEPWAVVVSPAAKTNWQQRSQIQGEDKKKLIKYLNNGLIKP